MVEYGEGVGQGTGGGGPIGVGGAGSQDLLAGPSQFFKESIETLAALPPEQLLLLVVVAFLGLIVLRRAF